MTFNRTVGATLLACIAPFAAHAQGIEFGAEMPLGTGTVRAFAETDATGLATRIGVEMSEEAVASLGHVAEGVYSARTVWQRASTLGVPMPITQAVVGLLDGQLKAHQAVAALMGRGPVSEVY